ncbi:ATP-binding protein [Wenjunlia tyrosinilytica]|uniref:ATP-binding protein n=1 Tax=Wenjunlia tyrosinilytica TaxID=1544741 RepID=UPI00166C944A|nr:ATP-binding protein [Wenjunlia tyrosinilytica]
MRLGSARDRSFVGRCEELKRFGAALRGEPGAAVVFYLHGPGGMGKTALLRRFADQAGRAGRTVVHVDGQHIDPCPLAFEAMAEAAASSRDAVLLIDSFEHCRELEGWLRERFLPRLHARTVTVLAARVPPSTHWACDPSWSGTLEVSKLQPLDGGTAAALLAERGVPPEMRDAVLAFAGGHPLALSLAASVGTRTRTADSTWTPTPQVIAALLDTLVGGLPSRHHRLALHTAAHTLSTTETLLSAVVGEEHAAPTFDWLRQLPFCHTSRHGLVLDRLVAQALDRDLRWRDPQGYERMHHQAGLQLLHQARTAPEPDVIHSVRALSYLKRHGPMQRYYRHITHDPEATEEALRPGDHDAVISMTEQAEGPRSARIAQYWLHRQPQAFRLYRSTHSHRPVAFMTWLQLTAPGDELDTDPMTAAAWKHVQDRPPLRVGQHLGMVRFMIHPQAHGKLTPLTQLMQLRICAHWIRSTGLAWSFVVTPHARLWAPLLHHHGHDPLQRTPWDRTRTLTLFAHDWRTTPAQTWLDRTQPGPLHEPAPTHHTTDTPLNRSQFDHAVREALRQLHDPIALENNPLLTSGMLTHHSTDPAIALRNLISETIDTLLDNPRHTKMHAAVTTTYLKRIRTQEAAAKRLGLPYSTYRRHLAQGVQRVCELMWRMHTTTTHFDADPATVDSPWLTDHE